jgi:hypothetical protein
MKATLYGARATRGIVAALVIGAGLAALAPAALAQTGGLTIKGKRWVNGVEAKVKCIAVTGHMLDASVAGTRTFTLAFAPDCFMFHDGDVSGQTSTFVFTGREDLVVKNGNPKPFREFSGVQVGAAPAVGAAGGRIKCLGPVCKSEKGVITYSRFESGFSIIFSGKYKASY